MMQILLDSSSSWATICDCDYDSCCCINFGCKMTMQCENLLDSSSSWTTRSPTWGGQSIHCYLVMTNISFLLSGVIDHKCYFVRKIYDVWLWCHVSLADQSTYQPFPAWRLIGMMFDCDFTIREKGLTIVTYFDVWLMSAEVQIEGDRVSQVKVKFQRHWHYEDEHVLQIRCRSLWSQSTSL